MRIIAIDDEPDALGLLRVVLEAAGAEVVTTSSALDALSRMAAAKPDAPRCEKTNRALIHERPADHFIARGDDLF